MGPTAAEIARQRAAWVTLLWGSLTLAGTVLVVTLTVWHLIRRGRKIRSTTAQPRTGRWPDLERKDS